MKQRRYIRVNAVIDALALDNRNQLATWWGIHRQTVYSWGEYLPELRVYELLDMRPEFTKLIEKKVA